MKGAALFAVGAASATCMVGSVALPQRDSSPLQARSTPLKMPIYQHNRRNLNDPEQTKQFAAAQHDYVRAKWGNHKVKREARESMAKRQIIGLSDVGGDSFYVGQIKIGTPAQDFNVILDTGSSDFWLADSGCSTAGCAALNLFDPTDSTSYQSSSTPFEVTYGSGAAEGTLASDTVSLAGYTVNSLTFAVCDQLAQGTLNAPASGIMGLGFQQLAASGATPFWQVLAEGSTFQKKVFTFQLARSGGSSTTSSIAPGGIFTLGQLDSSQYTGSVKYVDLSGSEGYWTSRRIQHQLCQHHPFFGKHCCN
jgi:cathepsin D